MAFDLAHGPDFTAMMLGRYIPYASRPPSPDMAQMCDDLGIEPRVQRRGNVFYVEPACYQINAQWGLGMLRK